MPRRRRFIESNALYEFSVRTREGLPFVCRIFMTLLIKSAIARTQRDVKVLLSHFLWMGNHAHFLVVSRDAEQMTRFYGELQKRLTDYLKRLFGLHHLQLWEGSISIIKIADVESAVERIAYLYANPARANLVDSITRYPGYSSYSAFTTATDGVLHKVSEKVPWVQAPAVTAPQTDTFTDAQDRFLAGHLRAKATKEHTLRVFPNLWLRCFGITAPREVARYRAMVLGAIEAHEQRAREARKLSGKPLLGPAALKKQSFRRRHTPKSHERRIFIIAKDIATRINYINWMNTISTRCRELYEQWKKLDFSGLWPPGVFKPPPPLAANFYAA